MNYLIKLIYQYTNVRTVLLALSILVLILSAIDPFIALINNRSYWIIALVIILLFCVLFVLLIPVVHLNDRNTLLLESIREVGLYDIENRAVATNQYLPETFFKKAKNEILILALTANTTLVEYSDMFKYLITDKAVRIKLIILYPERSLIEQLEKYNTDKLLEEINSTIEIIRNKSLYGEAGFEVKFIRNIPPYTAVLIDGDVDHVSAKPFDGGAEIRVQPSSIFENQHAGVIIHLLKTNPKTKGVFEFFASDMRNAWHECKEYPELFS